MKVATTGLVLVVSGKESIRVDVGAHDPRRA